jgi:hypothetical protein
MMMARMIRNFQDQVDELRDRVMERIRKEMPESGDFADILELFDNLDKPTQCYVGKYGMRVYKMPRYADADPRKRYVEIAAYVPSGEYKADKIVLKMPVLLNVRTDLPVGHGTHRKRS